MNNQLNDFIPLDDEEQTLSESFEAGEWQTVSLTAKEKQSYVSAAQRTLKTLEKRQISIKLNPVDISIVKAKAQETGIPYQNIIGTLIHNYAIGKIKLEI
jgi:predicted DNA binding CopG/RHH family protein